MYEMQGPRQAGQRYPADCPGGLVRRGNRRATRCPSYHRSRTPAGSPVARSSGLTRHYPLVLKVAPEVLGASCYPKLPPGCGSSTERSRNFIQASRSYPQDSRSLLRVVPVFAGREVLQPLPRAAQVVRQTISMIL